MDIRFSADIIEDSGLFEMIGELHLKKFFFDKNYGNNEVRFFFVINCIGENTKLRKRFDNKMKTLYWDVILSYKSLKNMKEHEKKETLAWAIINSFDILDKYQKLGIDKKQLKDDFEYYFKSIGWLK